MSSETPTTTVTTPVTEDYKVADTAAKNVADMLALDAEDESLRKVSLGAWC